MTGQSYRTVTNTMFCSFTKNNSSSYITIYKLFAYKNINKLNSQKVIKRISKRNLKDRLFNLHFICELRFNLDDYLRI